MTGRMMQLGGSTVTITLPGEPRGKGRPRLGRNMVHHHPQKTRDYQNALAWAAKAEMVGRPLFDGPLQAVCLAQMAIPPSWSLKKQQAAIRGEVRPTGKPDCDNILKCLDAFNGVVWRDDATVVFVQIEKRYSVSPCLVVTVSQVA